MSLLKGGWIILLGSLMIACGGGSSGGPSPGNASSSSVASSEAQSQVITFAANQGTSLRVGESFVNAAIGQGTGVVSYVSTDSWVASVDNDGKVTAKNPGKVKIIANKAADSRYLTASSSYSLEVEKGNSLLAWVGEKNSLLQLSSENNGANLYRSSAEDCDFIALTQCADFSSMLVNKDFFPDATRLDSPGYFRIKSTQGEASANVKLNAFFAPRFGGSITGFKNKIWAIGGKDGETYKNDIWSSVDGIDWHLESAQAAFAPRTNHKLLEHGGRLYLIGGEVGEEGYLPVYANDVWSSADGVDWQLETNNPGFSYRFDKPFISFNDKIWMIGGITANSIMEHNDIWSSVDGKHWVLENESAEFSPRRGHKLVAYQNRLWSIGSSSEHDIWSSQDAIHWTQEATTTGFLTSMELLEPFVFRDRLWLLGGNTDYVWVSDDGVNWTSAPSLPSFAARGSPAILLLNEKLWMIGGYDIGRGRNFEEVWISTDAHRWDLQSRGAAFTGRLGHQLVVHHDNLFVIGGEDSSLEYLSDVWSSGNVIDWNTRTPDAPFAPRRFHKAASFNDKMWVIGGEFFDYMDGGRDDVWSSLNGVNWIKESDNLWKFTQPGAKTYRLIPFKGSLWLIGTVEIKREPSGSTPAASVWSSQDGVNWQWRTKSVAPGFPVEAVRYQLIEFKDQLWLIGADYGRSLGVWSSSDGVAWQKRDVSGGLPGRQYHQLAVFKGKLWLVGGMGRPVAFDELANDVWSSEDGIQWVREVASAPFSPRIGHQLAVFNDQLVLVGGQSDGGEATINNEVWSSADGIEWRRGYRAPLNFIQ